MSPQRVVTLFAAAVWVFLLPLAWHGELSAASQVGVSVTAIVFLLERAFERRS